MSSGDQEMAKQCYSSSVKKVVTAAILLLILEVNMIAIYTYTMVDNSDLPDTPRKEDIVVRVKRVNREYMNTVSESKFGTIISTSISTVKNSLHITHPSEDSSSGDGQFPDDQTPVTTSSTGSENTQYFSKNHTSHFEHKMPIKDVHQDLISTLPNTYIIGGKTSEVDSLHQLLIHHPQIATVGAVNHFKSLPPAKGKHYLKRLPLVKPGKLLVEVDEDLFWSPSAPRLMKRTNPSARLILILRNPFERAVADFLTMHKGLEGSGYQTYEGYFVNSDGTSVNADSPVIIPSLYDEHMKRWLSCFNFTQILFLDYTHLMTHPYTVLNRVENFLGVKKFHKKNSFSRYSDDTICAKWKGGSNAVCLSVDHPDLALSPELDKALKSFFTQHLNSFWSIVSKHVSVNLLPSLVSSV